MENGRVVAHAAITRAGARPLDHDEVRRVFAVNLCLICHDDRQGPDLPQEAGLRCARRSLFIAGCWLLSASRPRPGPRRAPRRRPRRTCLACHPSARGRARGPDGDARGGAARSRGGPSAREGDRFFAPSCTRLPRRRLRRLPRSGAARRGEAGEDEACPRCHRGYFVGWDYHGRAPREDHARYQRGAVADGEPFLKMLPDVHRERGMTCADCHTHAVAARRGRRPRRPAGTATPRRRARCRSTRSPPTSRRWSATPATRPGRRRSTARSWCARDDARAAGGLLAAAAPGGRGGRAPT